MHQMKALVMCGFFCVRKQRSAIDYTTYLSCLFLLSCLFPYLIVFPYLLDRLSRSFSTSQPSARHEPFPKKVLHVPASLSWPSGRLRPRPCPSFSRSVHVHPSHLSINTTNSKSHFYDENKFTKNNKLKGYIKRLEIFPFLLVL